MLTQYTMFGITSSLTRVFSSLKILRSSAKEAKPAAERSVSM